MSFNVSSVTDAPASRSATNSSALRDAKSRQRIQDEIVTEDQKRDVDEEVPVEQVKTEQLSDSYTASFNDSTADEQNQIETKIESKKKREQIISVYAQNEESYQSLKELDKSS
jgi:hypothetical protein